MAIAWLAINLSVRDLINRTGIRIFAAFSFVLHMRTSQTVLAASADNSGVHVDLGPLESSSFYLDTQGLRRAFTLPFLSVDQSNSSCLSNFERLEETERTRSSSSRESKSRKGALSGDEAGTCDCCRKKGIIIILYCFLEKIILGKL